MSGWPHKKRAPIPDRRPWCGRRLVVGARREQLERVLAAGTLTAARVSDQLGATDLDARRAVSAHLHRLANRGVLQRHRINGRTAAFSIPGSAPTPLPPPADMKATEATSPEAAEWLRWLSSPIV